MLISEFFGDANHWLGVIYSARLLDSYFSIRIDHFTNTDGDRLNWSESILQYFLHAFRVKKQGQPVDCSDLWLTKKPTLGCTFKKEGGAALLIVTLFLC